MSIYLYTCIGREKVEKRGREENIYNDFNDDDEMVVSPNKSKNDVVNKRGETLDPYPRSQPVYPYESIAPATGNI
jgi:hypothetical protein